MLPFIPRKVARQSKLNKPPTISSSSCSTPIASTAHVTPETVPSTSRDSSGPKGKEKEHERSTLGDEQVVALLSMTMSDYALWFDADLRRTIEFAEDGFVPLVSIVNRMLPHLGPKTHLSEALLVKAIRCCGSDAFDIRMLMSSPSRAMWYGGNPSKDDIGSFEISLKGWKDALERINNKTRQDWDRRTIYVENTPPQYRSVAGIHTFVTSLLPEAGSPSNAQQIQTVTLPRHHQDKPTDQPKCKGFALVTLSRMEDVDLLLHEWPWQRRLAPTPEASDTSSIHQDATRFGVRITSKAHWDTLNAEYTVYRQKLLDELAAEEPDDPVWLEQTTAPPSVTQPAPEEPVPRGPVLDLTSPFPPGCLAYVRNVHPETNKTTLRKLFAQACAESDTSGDGIDYVDFNKGMDSCHLRLAKPEYTQLVVKHFSEQPLVQTHGLDGVGTTQTDCGRKPLSFEIVSGEREGLYWGKVPEKVKRQAVEKAVFGGAPPADQEARGQGDVPQRKRRRVR